MDRDPDELWTEFWDTVTTVADKHIPRIKKKKVTKWLSETANKISEKKREAKSKGDQEAATRLNTAFQRHARKDKETNLRHKCEKIEQCNRTVRMRYLYQESKTVTGIFNARCGTLKGPTGGTVTEEKEVKEKWKEYTEELYRKNPGISVVFIEKVFDDEPYILEAEVKQAISQLANRKAAGCDGIPVELLKAVDDDAIKVLTRIYNSIWKNKK